MVMETKSLAAAIPAAASRYDEMPLSIVVFRFLWPFWLFQDASRGTHFDRAAAYRHNRDMRIYLPGYLLKWLLSSALIFAVTVGVDSLATQMAQSNVLVWMAAGCGMMFACGICVLFMTAYIYVYLSRHDR
jgi:hypothetical protein